MKFEKNEEAVSPVIGVILMVAITVILAAVIAAFVFNLGGSQEKAPTASIVAANAPDTPGVDMKIQHKGGDLLKGGEWKISIVPVGSAPVFITSDSGNDLGVGAMITTHNWTSDGTTVLNATKSALYYNSASGKNTTGDTWNPASKVDVKLVHIPSNAMLVDTVIEVR
jgi:flagellin-like protein